IENPDDPIPAIGRRFIKWYDSKPKDIGNCCRAVIACARALRASDMGGWHHAAQRVHDETGGQTAGNGALMRTIYPALWYAGHQMAVDIGYMTHAHDDSRIALIAYTRAIYDVIKDEAGGVDGDEIGWRKHWVSEGMKHARKAHEGTTLRPDGYVLNSLVCAINAIRDTNSFEDALAEMVNLGGDADTIGAITGGLAGAIYGAKAIPQRWIDALDKGLVRRMEQLAEMAVK
ncbi:MAG: ADP-ribosylglycohydrolase family protein, partial [Synergistaceae bacterium]|nr:ADP-ribosylglycohydrolase family protein [Synergistaceae bacterium]